MNRGRYLVGAGAILALAACSGGQGRLEIRPSATPIAAGAKPVPLRVAEGRGQLRLGNVALALESFRKAAREDPSSLDALAGIAACYDRMGRFDLSRRHYEAALALAPGDVQLLNAFAGSLAIQGRSAEAAAVRQEIATRQAVAMLPPAEPAFEAAALPSTDLAPQFASSPITFSEAVEAQPSQAPESAVAPIVRSEAQPQVGAPEAFVSVARPAIGRSVTIALPPPRPAAPAPAIGRSVTVTLPPPRPAEPQQPRLERLSMGEVALVTAAGPRWQSFVPDRSEMADARVRLLNAARVHRLAARTRAYLGARGWRSVSIGDAESVRARSVILYPAGQRSLARKLAAQFGFATVPRKDVRQVTVLLGRDSVQIAGARARG